MRIEALTVALRPRTAWEAVELGMALTRRHAGAIWRPWLLLSLPLLWLLTPTRQHDPNEPVALVTAPEITRDVAAELQHLLSRLDRLGQQNLAFQRTVTATRHAADEE